VIGDEGAIQVGRLRKTPVRLLDRSGAHHDAVFTTPDRMGDAFVAMLQSFVDCVAKDTEPPVQAVDARATLEVAIAGRQSIQTGEPVAIDHITDQPPEGGVNTK
jgi:myo-inositol 2-dehydrogenase/D-chiro-inositol 1-dehydrogenase